MDIDVIGDIHGHADALEALLLKLGYRERNGTWRHPSKRAAFVGDLVDRGPRQLETIEIVRRMRDAGTADVVMGNHEFNAIAFFEKDPARSGAHYRTRNAKNIGQHAVFLEAVGGADTVLHAEMVAFFRTLPLWFETPTVRVVHACWSPDHIAALAPNVDGENCLTEAGFHAAQIEGSVAWAAVETLLKGPEMTLPDGLPYRDAQGAWRTRSRTKWWNETALTLRTACVEGALAKRLPDAPLPEGVRFHYDRLKPIFFGHYWMPGEPHLLGADRACLDFSVAKGGVLCAYRHDGSPTLDPANLVWVKP